MLINILLLLFCAFVAVLAWTLIQHLFLTVPFIPTPQQTVEKMIDAAHLKGDETVYDLGAGDARVLLTAKEKYPGITAKGCELVWVVWCLGKFRIWMSDLDIGFSRKSVYRIDVSDADVIFLYLFPSMMGKLASRFDRMLKPGTTVVSHAFKFPGKEEEKLIRYGDQKIYVYRWNA